LKMRNIAEKISVFVHRVLAVAAATTLVLLAPAVGQTAKPGAHVGMLTCQMVPGIGLTVESVQPVRCHFVPDEGDLGQVYIGEINTVGQDAGIATGGVLVWDVLTSTGASPSGRLAGIYVVAKGDVSMGPGASVNLLSGGPSRDIALQPIALEGEIEVALGLDVSGLKLVTAFQ
jgi:hypothetical protein